MKMAVETTTGIAYLLPALAMGAVWYVLLFVGSAQITPSEMLRYTLVEAPERHHFWWTTVYTALCLLLAIAYCSTISRRRLAAFALCGIGIVLAAATWLTMDWAFGVFVTFPLLFSFQRVKWHLTARLKADAQ